MATTRHSGEDADIDLGGLFVAIWRRRMLVLTSTVVLGGLAFAGTSVVSPKYQSEARILIETRSPDLARRPTDVQSADTGLDDAGITSQVALLQSADLIRQVARDFKLSDRPEFDPAANPSLMTRVMVMAHLVKNPLDVEPEDRVITEFTQKLQVYQVEKSRVIAIQFSSKDPKLAAQIPNAMAKVYLSLQSGAKLDSTSETAKWLEPEIANLREKVQNAEAKVAEYRASSDIFKTGQENTFSQQQLTDVSQELARVRGDRATAQARAESVRAALSSGRSVDTLNEVVGSQMIQRLKETQSGIEGQLADLSTQLLDGHPRIKGLRSQLEGIRQQIRQETQKILVSLENEAGVAKSREQQLVQQLNSVKADSANTDEKQVGLNALEREAAAQRQLLETYLARYREALSEQDMNATPADARIVSSAVMPTEPYFPKTVPIIVVASLAGFVLSSVFVMLAELFSGRAIRPIEYEDEDEDQIIDAPARHHQVTGVTDAPLVAQDIEAEAKPAPQKPAVGGRESLLSMAFDQELNESMAAAADAHLQATDEDEEFSVGAVARHLIGNKINIAISVSLIGEEGSSATVALARTIAELGGRIIVVDMTGSALPTRLMANSPALPGITNLLTGEAAFAETIHADQMSDAHILPQGTADARRAMRGADRLAMIVDALANAYDLVLVECGPTDVAGVSRLARKGEAEIILSAAGAPMDEIEGIAGSFIDAGYEDVVLMLGKAESNPPSSGRKAA
ncbi:MAG: chain length determinant family protein [Rhizobium sp.]|nr:chain length determinant family protein [Rhizobium sp.]